MYIVENIEKLPEILNKIELIGICMHEKNFQKEFIIYLRTKKKNMQIQSFVPFPDESKVTFKEVNSFTLPFTDETSKYFIPKVDENVVFKLDSAENIEYNYSESGKLGDEQVLFSQYFSIGIQSQMILVLNMALLEECEINNLIEYVL